MRTSRKEVFGNRAIAFKRDQVKKPTILCSHRPHSVHASQALKYQSVLTRLIERNEELDGCALRLSSLRLIKVIDTISIVTISDLCWVAGVRSSESLHKGS